MRSRRVKGSEEAKDFELEEEEEQPKKWGSMLPARSPTKSTSEGPLVPLVRRNPTSLSYVTYKYSSSFP